MEKLEERIPLLIVGDAPTLPTGLGRIARDVIELVRRDSLAERLPFRVAQLGLKYDGRVCNWHVYPTYDQESWGMHDVAPAWEDWVGELAYASDRGVILTIWDPGRCPAIAWALNKTTQKERRGLTPIQDWVERKAPWPRLWGYFAVDAADPQGGLGGPVPETLKIYQRVLAYTSWGAEVLEKACGRPVPSLPHGIDLDIFAPQSELPADYPAAWKEDIRPLIGVVATNTPRKDWGVVFAALNGIKARLWVHIDQLTTAAWSITELASQFGRNSADALLVTLALSDEEMAKWYSACDATLAPGLGEGFGYPIVESLACGTPAIHVNYGGGRGLVPTAAWRFAPVAQRLEGPYALIRPVLNPGEVRETLRAAVSWARREPEIVREYCRGSVAHLDWRNLWPYWRQWFREGIEGL